MWFHESMLLTAGVSGHRETLQHLLLDSASEPGERTIDLRELTPSIRDTIRVSTPVRSAVPTTTRKRVLGLSVRLPVRPAIEKPQTVIVRDTAAVLAITPSRVAVS